MIAKVQAAFPHPPAAAVARQPVICQLVHTLNVGGAELLARQFAEAACDRYRFVFVCLDCAGEMADELRGQGYAVEVIGRKPGFDPGCAWRLMRVLRQHEVAAVHAHQYAPFFYATLSRWLRPRTLPIVFTEHGRDYPDYPRPKRKLANRLLLRPCDRIIAVGNCVRDALIQNEGLPARRVEVIYNGVDLSRYDPRRPLRNSVRAELGWRDDTIGIMQVARLNRLKDHRTALQSVAQLARELPQVRLALVGDGDERSALEELVVELALQGVVRFLGTRNDIPRLLQGGDVFLLSSITEGIPLTLIEAMASGLPCVATRVGGNGEVVIDGHTGYLAEPRDPAALACKLRQVICDSRVAEQMGMAGRSRCEQHFSDRRMHARYDDVYRDVLGSRAESLGNVQPCQDASA